MNEKPWQKGSLATGLWRKLKKELNDEAYDVSEKDSTRASAFLRYLFPRQPFGAELVSSLSIVPTGILVLSALGSNSKVPFFVSSMFTFLLSYCAACYDVYVQEVGQNPHAKFTDILYSPFNGLCDRALLKEWKFHVLGHAVLMIIHVFLMSNVIVRCGLTRALIVVECGHTAAAILAFASKYYVNAAISSTYSSSGSSASSSMASAALKRRPRAGSDLIDTMSATGADDGSSTSVERSSDLVNDTTKGRPEDALLLSVALIAGGAAILMYCDLHSTTNAVLCICASVVCYLRSFCLLPLPKKLQTLPLGVAGTLVVPFGIRSLVVAKFAPLIDPEFWLSLAASVFSVNCFKQAPFDPFAFFLICVCVFCRDLQSSGKCTFARGASVGTGCSTSRQRCSSFWSALSWSSFSLWSPNARSLLWLRRASFSPGSTPPSCTCPAAFPAPR